MGVWDTHAGERGRWGRGQKISSPPPGRQVGAGKLGARRGQVGVGRPAGIRGNQNRKGSGEYNESQGQGAMGTQVSGAGTGKGNKPATHTRHGGKGR